MKNRVKTVIFLIGIFLLQGCGESINSDLKSKGSIELTPGVEMVVYPGDKLRPADADTVVKVRHDVQDTLKYITLLKGNLTLVRGNYNFRSE